MDQKEPHAVCLSDQTETVMGMDESQMDSRDPLQNPVEVAAAVDEFQRAIAQLPSEDTSAFFEALSVAPEIVAKESDALSFLRVDQFDINRATRRMAKYWQFRKALFGDRAFLALSAFPTGALSTEDVKVLLSGAFARLPNDKHLRPVICIDNERASLKMTQSVAVRGRLMVYWMDVLARETTLHQTDGFQILRVVRTPSFTADKIKRMLHLLLTTMPCKVRAFHLCCIVPEDARRHFMSLVVPVLAQATGEVLPGRVFIHVGRTESEIGLKLQHYGMKLEGLPASLGGTWQYSNHESWVRELTANPKSTGTDVVRNLETQSQSHATHTADESSVSRLARKRQSDAEYAREKRKRDRQSMEDLKREHSAVAETNAILSQENARLQRLLAEAQCIVERYQTHQRPTQKTSYEHRPGVALDALQRSRATLWGLWQGEGKSLSPHWATFDAPAEDRNASRLINGLPDSNLQLRLPDCPSITASGLFHLGSQSPALTDAHGVSRRTPLSSGFSPSGGGFLNRLPEREARNISLTAPTVAVGTKAASFTSHVPPPSLAQNVAGHLLQDPSQHFRPSLLVGEARSRPSLSDQILVSGLQASLARSLHEAEIMQNLLRAVRFPAGAVPRPVPASGTQSLQPEDFLRFPLTHVSPIQGPSVNAGQTQMLRRAVNSSTRADQEGDQGRMLSRRIADEARRRSAR